MTNHPILNLATIENVCAPRRERVRAARELARWARVGPAAADEVPGVFEKVSALWRELCASQEPASLPLFHDRAGVASACTTVSLALPEGQRTPLFEWLRKQHSIIWCSRCGLEITYEISRDCPARAMRGKAGSGGPQPVQGPDQ